MEKSIKLAIKWEDMRVESSFNSCLGSNKGELYVASDDRSAKQRVVYCFSKTQNSLKSGLLNHYNVSISLQQKTHLDQGKVFIDINGNGDKWSEY